MADEITASSINQADTSGILTIEEWDPTKINELENRTFGKFLSWINQCFWKIKNDRSIIQNSPIFDKRDESGKLIFESEFSDEYTYGNVSSWTYVSTDTGVLRADDMCSEWIYLEKPEINNSYLKLETKVSLKVKFSANRYDRIKLNMDGWNSPYIAIENSEGKILSKIEIDNYYWNSEKKDEIIEYTSLFISETSKIRVHFIVPEHCRSFAVNNLTTTISSFSISTKLYKPKRY